MLVGAQGWWVRVWWPWGLVMVMVMVMVMVVMAVGESARSLQLWKCGGVVVSPPHPFLY